MEREPGWLAAERLALDLSWVAPRLAVGGRLPPESAERLAGALGIRCVVDLRVEECDDERVLSRAGIELLHLPTVDGRAVSQRMLADGVAWVTEKLARDLAVYVHCQHGIGRSALLALCVLVAQGRGPLEALSLAKQARPCVSPSPEQLEAYRRWLAAHRARTGLPLPVPSLEQLSRIAYR